MYIGTYPLINQKPSKLSISCQKNQKHNYKNKKQDHKSLEKRQLKNKNTVNQKLCYT